MYTFRLMQRSKTMDENRERGKGKLDEVVGNVKQGLGNLTGNERLEAEGHAQELSGEGRQEFAKGVGTAKGAMQDMGGNIKEGLGNLVGNDRLAAEGEADQMMGEGRKRLNS
jgi:uncharacterized protein YjbJ (UPF0337 family)